MRSTDKEVHSRQLTVNSQKKEKDLTQRIQRPEHGGHREEGKGTGLKTGHYKSEERCEA
jgi:hypothetical protein